MATYDQTISDDDKEILDEATERFEQIQSDDKDNRDNYRADTRFVFTPGQQWPEEVRATRSAWKEICLEFNQLKQFVAQVVNDQRQNRPGVRFHPASGEASEEVAEIMQGMTRSIENESNAESVYDNAFQCAVVGGRGAWRICSEYADDHSFNQRLCIKPINDMMTVWADLNYQQPDGSDREFVFVEESFSKSEFKRKYPSAQAVSWDNLQSCWGNDNLIRVVDYYRRVCKKRTLVMMSDGAVGYKDELPEDQIPEGITIAQEREVDEYSVEWYTIAGGQQVLNKTNWPGPIIPVIIIAGDDMIIDGKRCYQGLTRHARDAQAMLNFGMTQQAIHLSLTPRAPWVMAEGQNEGYEEMWRDANNKNFSALIYKPTTIDGIAVPPPQRTAPSLPDAGWQGWCQMMIGMIKSTIGMYENSLGQRGPESSGRAIIAKQKEGDNATFNFVDNLSRGIALTGKILQYAFPVFYDTQQMVQVINPDDTRKLVMINQQSPNPDNPVEAIKNNDVTVGKYAVTCEAGPSYATKREETAENLLRFMDVLLPEQRAVMSDIAAKSLDFADSDVVADRLRLMLPPQIQQAEAAKKEGKNVDPQLIAEMQQKDQMLAQAKETMDKMQGQLQQADEAARAADLKAQQATSKALSLQIQLEKQTVLREIEEAQENAMPFDGEMIKSQQQAQLEQNKMSNEYELELNKAALKVAESVVLAQLTPKPQSGEQEEETSNSEQNSADTNQIMQMLIETQQSFMQQLAAPKVAQISVVKNPDGSYTGQRIEVEA